MLSASSKFRRKPSGLQTPLDSWLYFLQHAESLDTAALPAALQVPEIVKAFQELVMVTQSERDWAAYEDRFKAEMDARNNGGSLKKWDSKRAWPSG